MGAVTGARRFEEILHLQSSNLLDKFCWTWDVLLDLKSDAASCFIICFPLTNCIAQPADSNMMLSFQIVFERRLMLRLVTFFALAYVSKWSVAPAEFSFFSLVTVAVIRMLGPR